MAKRFLAAIVSVFTLLSCISAVSFAEDTATPETITINVLETEGTLDEATGTHYDYFFNGNQETTARGEANTRLSSSNEDATKVNTNTRLKYKVNANTAGNYQLSFDLETQWTTEYVTNNSKTNRVHFQVIANGEEVVTAKKIEETSVEDWNGTFTEGGYISYVCDTLIPLKAGENDIEIAIYGGGNLTPLGITTGALGLAVRTTDSFKLTPADTTGGEGEGGDDSGNTDAEPTETITINVLETEGTLDEATGSHYDYFFNGNQETTARGEANTRLSSSNEDATKVNTNTRLKYKVNANTAGDYQLSFDLETQWTTEYVTTNSKTNRVYFQVIVNGEEVVAAKKIEETSVEDWNGTFTKDSYVSYVCDTPIPLNAGENDIEIAIYGGSNLTPLEITTGGLGLAVRTTDSFKLTPADTTGGEGEDGEGGEGGEDGEETEDVLTVNVLETIDGKDYFFNGTEDTATRGTTASRIPATNTKATKVNTNTRLKYKVTAEKAGLYQLSFDLETQYNQEAAATRTNRVHFQVKANGEEVIAAKKIEDTSIEGWDGAFPDGKYITYVCDELIPLKAGENEIEIANHFGGSLTDLGITTGALGYAVRTDDSFLFTLKEETPLLVTGSLTMAEDRVSADYEIKANASDAGRMTAKITMLDGAGITVGEEDISFDYVKGDTKISDNIAIPETAVTVKLTAASGDVTLEKTLSLLPVNKDPFKDDKNINIVYLGDSIYEGTGASSANERWVNQVTAWFTQTYAKDGVTVTPHYKGVGGTTTEYSLARLERDVIAADPDLVFISATINDGNRDVTRNLESMVLTLQGLDNPPYIIFTRTTSRAGSESRGFVDEVAKAYNIPLIDDYKAFLAATTVKPGEPMTDLFADTAHPNDAGYDVITNEIIKCLETGRFYGKGTVASEKLNEKSDIIGGTSWFFAGDKTKTGSWTEGTTNSGIPYIQSGAAGDTLEFAFNGNILLFEYGLHKNGLDIEVWVDGVKQLTCNPRYSDTITSHQRVGKENSALLDLADGDHTVKIVMAANDAVTGTPETRLYNIVTGSWGTIAGGGEDSGNTEVRPADTITINSAETKDGKVYNFGGTSEYAQGLQPQGSKGTSWINGNTSLTYEIEVAKDAEYILSFDYLSAYPLSASNVNTPIIQIRVNDTTLVNAEVLSKTTSDWNGAASETVNYVVTTPIPLKAGKNTFVFAVHNSSSKPVDLEATPSGMAVKTEGTFVLTRIKPEIDAYNPTFDEANKTVSATVSLNSKKEDQSNLNVVIFVAVYEDGRLVDYKQEPVSLPNGQQKDYTVTIENVADTVNKAKVFVWGWDGVDANTFTLRPFTEVLETTR